MAGSIVSMISVLSRPLGRGNCSRMPSTRSSAFSDLISASNSARLVVTARSCAKDAIPHSSQALRLLRTYTAEAGSSPTFTTASPGARPYLETKSAALAADLALSFAATAFPSRIFAVKPLSLLVTIVIGLERTGFRNADVLRLRVGELGQHDVERLQLQSRHLFIEMLAQDVHTERVLRGLREQFDLRDGLVREARAHYVARVTRA